MHSAGPTGPTDKRSAELIGGLYLVGTRGKCCAVVTERQLTIERFDGKGVRLDLAAIDRMRHLKVPILPSGTILLGLIGVYLGITTFVPPMSWFAIILGSSAILANIFSRYAILAIETGTEGRHLISGGEANLLKLCMLVDRVRHGTPIHEALVGLESLETELPTFPAIRDAAGRLGNGTKAYLPPVMEPDHPDEGGLDGPMKVDLGSKGHVDMGSFDLPPEGLASPVASPTLSDYKSESNEGPKKSAYERAWGGREAPTWYREKEFGEPEESRMESALSDASQGLEMFSPGGLFDFESQTDESDLEEDGLFGSDFGFGDREVSPRPPSSAEMIKRAHDEFGFPSEPYVRPSLPPPTEEAVRDECKAGVVKQARARQELRVQNLKDRTIQPANLEDYPALNRLASTMSSNRISGVKPERRRFSTGWLGRLLSPGTHQNSQTNSESDGEIETKKFQTAQYMRLRSDQDHQAEVASRVRSMRNSMESATARDKLDSIVRNIAEGEEEAPRLLEAPRDNLRFSQLRPTSSEEDPHPLPGLRRLG